MSTVCRVYLPCSFVLTSKCRLFAEYWSCAGKSGEPPKTTPVCIHFRVEPEHTRIYVYIYIYIYTYIYTTPVRTSFRDEPEHTSMPISPLLTWRSKVCPKCKGSFAERRSKCSTSLRRDVRNVPEHTRMPFLAHARSLSFAERHSRCRAILRKDSVFF